MQSVNCTCWLPYTPDAVYAALTDPDKLAAVVKRLRRIEVLDRDGESGDVLATIDVPGGKSFRTRGHVEGVAGESLTFKTDAPIYLAITWRLEAHDKEGIAGVDVDYTIEVDFAPIASFVSGLMVKGYLSSEMQRDLATLDDLMHTTFSPA